MSLNLFALSFLLALVRVQFSEILMCDLLWNIYAVAYV
jgi:hypothetical protein